MAGGCCDQVVGRGSESTGTPFLRQTLHIWTLASHSKVGFIPRRPRSPRPPWVGPPLILSTTRCGRRGQVADSH